MGKQNLLEMANLDKVDVLEKAGLFEGTDIKDDRKKKILAYMYAVNENDAEVAGVDFEKLDETAGNTTADVNVLAKMMSPIITRGFGQASAMEICGTWPLKTDQGRIAYMRNFYTNDQANPVRTPSDAVSGLNLGIGMVVADASAFAVGGAITSDGGATGVVRFINSNSMFVEVTAGTFAVGDNLDNANPYVGAETTCSEVYSSEIAHNVFGRYTQFASIYAGEIATTTIKEAEIGIDLMNVQADSHKIRMRYTNEFTHRLRDYYGIDADALTDSCASLAFRQGLNRDVFDRVFALGTTGGTSGWDYVNDTDGRWEEEKIKTLMTTLNFRSADILNANFMIPGNYIIVDPIIYAFFVSYGYLDTTMLPGGMAQPMKNAFVGILNGSFRVYVNPWLRQRTIVMGSKDFSGEESAETRAGLFFHPYLALDVTKTIQDSSGQPVKFFQSFYGFTSHPFSATVGTNDFFRRINVTQLPNV